MVRGFGSGVRLSGQRRFGLMRRLALLVLFAGPAQARNYEVLGNLEATVNPGCIVAASADPVLSPPDLGLGVLACAKAGQMEKALDLYILMQLRAEFDKKRVVDKTAWQAEDVLSSSVAQSMGTKRRNALEAEFDAFGGDGSPRHKAFCAGQKKAGAPSHSPRWMVAHGMGAVIGEGQGDGTRAGFKAKSAWSRLLKDYLHCGG
jgi:hypothetical protein